MAAHLDAGPAGPPGKCPVRPRARLFLLSDALRHYHGVNAALPNYIVAFRDGVGDGQVMAVRDHEVAQLRESIKASAPE